jgi:hypothetical protein
MSDTTPHDGTPKPETDAAPARPDQARPSAGAPAHGTAATGDADPSGAADEASKRHDAELAAATERANSGSLTGEYTETEYTETEYTEGQYTEGQSAEGQSADRASVTNTAATSAAQAAVASGATSIPPVNAPPIDYAPTTPPAQTPIYVQAPTPPKDRSNRGGGILIALVATLVFAVIYAGAVFTIVGLSSSTINETTRIFTEFVAQWVFFVPVFFFFLAFALLVSVVNRAGWWSYVLFGFLVAAVVYVSYVGSVLLTVQAWTLSSSEIAGVLSQQWFAPFAIAAAIIAREVPIWFGAWISRRGRGVTSRNLAARTEYERVLAQGPQVTRSK